MGVDSSQLLKSLGSCIRPAGSDRTPSSSSTRPVDVATGSFAQMLQAASGGQISSGAPVTLAKTSGLTLSPAQMQRLASAADRAQAEGADRALVLMDGMALNLDVATRTITGQVKVEPGTKMPQVMTGVDTVINVPSESDAVGPVMPLAKLASSGVTNASLLKTLSERSTPDPVGPGLSTLNSQAA